VKKDRPVQFHSYGGDVLCGGVLDGVLLRSVVVPNGQLIHEETEGCARTVSGPTADLPRSRSGARGLRDRFPLLEEAE